MPLREVFRSVLKARTESNLSNGDTVLMEAIAKSPNNPKLLCELAENKIMQENWQEAANILSAIKDLDPPFLRALSLLGRCRMKMQDYDGAVQALSKAQVLNPFKAERLVALGQCLLKLDRTKEAKENFEGALAIEPENKEALHGKGECLLLEGEINEALELLKDVSNSRELASIFNSAAIVAMRKGQYSEGFSLYDAASLATTQDNLVQARLFFNKGIGYRRSKQDNKALECFVKAIKFDNSYTKAKRNYMFITKKLGVAVEPELQGLLNSVPETVKQISPASAVNNRPHKDVDQDMEIGVGIDMNDSFESDFDEDSDPDNIAIL